MRRSVVLLGLVVAPLVVAGGCGGGDGAVTDGSVGDGAVVDAAVADATAADASPPDAASVTCSALTAPTNGAVTTTNSGQYPSTATYTCDPDYRPIGLTSRTCDATGSWSGVPPTCVPGICGDRLLRTGEGCDDGNVATGDGCGATCQVEVGSWCNTMVVPSRCSGAMVPVVAGPFMMGEGTTGPQGPLHEVMLPQYAIDEHEVTNAEYLRCERDLACTAPSNLTSRSGRSPYHTAAAYAEYPVIWVNWAKASAYCAWAGKRLPTEAEWEKAARGGCEKVAPATCGTEDQRTYPWGETVPTCSLANFHPGTGACVASGLGDTDAVGVRPGGDSPYGAHDMAGNVWEWVEDWYDPVYYASCAAGCSAPQGPASSPAGARVLRGGSFEVGNSLGDFSGLRLAFRSYYDPASQYFSTGFRCARTP